MYSSQKEFPELCLCFLLLLALLAPHPAAVSGKQTRGHAPPRRSSPANGNARFPLRHRVKGYSYGRVPNVNSLICWRAGEIYLSDYPVSQFSSFVYLTQAQFKCEHTPDSIHFLLIFQLSAMRLLSKAVQSAVGQREWSRRHFWGWLNAVFNK